MDGFVQQHPTLAPGVPFENTTVGEQQFVVDFTIQQDTSTGNWWVIAYGVDKIGYWPKELFPHLANGASSVRYGGMASASPKGESPPMGSGQLPNIFYMQTCYFKFIQIINSDNQKVEIDGKNFQVFADSKLCYNLEYYGDQGAVMEETFSFGGPGGNNCGN
ncbi:hypothetical protein Tsubulata_009361 [Turnera subulata]|uniref:Neprosin PEP catalytic domain-containing protein n=1 Tax=Turnera subulata TaxID=218843 RepID=A0A9Q0JP65_9ROSI|nr:hypothetical protein Tsubulata_009361 [Turnera subulata]